MIQGSVSEHGLPVIEIEVAGTKWPANIDTGFNGDLELPDALRSQLPVRSIGRVVSWLAGGQRVEEDGYLVDFPFDGKVVAQAEVTFVPGAEILIGTHLLAKYRLTVDFPNGFVVVERLNDNQLLAQL